MRPSTTRHDLEAHAPEQQYDINTARPAMTTVNIPSVSPASTTVSGTIPTIPSLPSATPLHQPTPHTVASQRDPKICPTDDEAILPRRDIPKRKLDKQSWEYIIKSGVAGGIAGCAAKTVVAPLDRVKILFQTSNPQYAKYSGSWSGFVTALRGIYSQDGSKGLFRGHSATLLRIFPYAGIKFLAYEQIRNVVIPSKEYETSVRRFVSGSAAGMMSVLFTYPLEVIRVRLAFQTTRDSRNSLAGIVKKIYHESPRIASPANPSETLPLKSVPLAGVANFFRGFTATLCGMIPYAGASFLAHDSAADFLRTPAVSNWTVLPNSGGTEANPNKRPQLKYWAELSAGGFAGFVSQTVSYPLEVIRRRMQVGGVVGDGHRLRMGEVAARIFAERGFKGFFVGLGIGYLKVVPMAATSFFAYERAKWYLGI